MDKALRENHRKAKNDKHTYGVLLLDIDYFKQVNDHYGHQIGDQVLTEISTLLREHVRDSEIVGRWGGEEFLVVCAGADNDILWDLAERLRESIENHVFPKCISLTTSIGVAAYEHGDDIQNLLSRADKALYKAKGEGRNKVAS